MAKPPKRLSKAEEADVLRRKANDYYVGKHDPASDRGMKNVASELGNKKSSVTGMDAAKRRVDEVRKPGGKDQDKANAGTERLEALRSLKLVDDREYRKRKKER